MPTGQIVVIGDPDAVFGFGLLGLQGVVVAGQDAARKAIRQACRQPEVTLILVSDSWASLIRELEQERVTGSGPLIVPFPSLQSTSAEPGLRGEIRRILGVSL